MRRAFSRFLGSVVSRSVLGVLDDGADDPTLELRAGGAPMSVVALEGWLQCERSSSVCCQLHDLSEYGVRLVAEQPVPVGTEGLMRVFTPQGIVRFKIVVTWSRPLGLATEAGARIIPYRGGEPRRVASLVKSLRSRG